jgi:hypothetical protein
VPRKDASKPGREKKLSVVESDTTPSAEGGEAFDAPESSPREEHRENGGWQEIEAMREKAALKASLADVWDEDFDLDDEILAELDHTAEFFTPQEETKDEVFDDVDEIDEFFDEEDD